jgi:hypothetical protein
VLKRLSLAMSRSEARQARLTAKQTWLATLVPVLTDIRRAGHKTAASIARELNAKGVPTRCGGRWTRSLVERALSCLPADERQSIYVTQKDFALRLRPVIVEIQADGKTVACSIASELNARGIPGLNGGRWRAPQVLSLVKRISMVATSRADWLPRLALIIADIRAAGHHSWIAMARQLNARGVRPLMGGRWNKRKVGDALTRMRRHKINYEPKRDFAFPTQVRAAKAKSTRQPRGHITGARLDEASANANAFRSIRRPSKRHSRGVRKSPRRCKRRAAPS